MIDKKVIMHVEAKLNLISSYAGVSRVHLQRQMSLHENVKICSDINSAISDRQEKAGTMTSLND